MEFLFELLLELILEGSIAGSTNKKFPLVIRILLGFIVIAFLLSVTIGLIVIGIFITKENKGGLFILAVGLLLLVCVIKKIYNLYIKGEK